MTIRLSVDDQPTKIRRGFTAQQKAETAVELCLPAGGPLMQCCRPAAWASLQQPGPLGAAGPH